MHEVRGLVLPMTSQETIKVIGMVREKRDLAQAKEEADYQINAALWKDRNNPYRVPVAPELLKQLLDPFTLDQHLQTNAVLLETLGQHLFPAALRALGRRGDRNGDLRLPVPSPCHLAYGPWCLAVGLHDRDGGLQLRA